MSVVESRLSRLRSSVALSQLDEGRLQKLSAFTRGLEVPVGAALAEDGRWLFALGVMWEGTADVFIGGQEVAGIGPGALLGEISRLQRGKRTAISLLENGRQSIRVVTTSDAKLTIIDHRAFDDLQAEHPSIARDLKRIASARSHIPA